MTGATVMATHSSAPTVLLNMGLKRSGTECDIALFPVSGVSSLII